MTTITTSDQIKNALVQASCGENAPDWGNAPMELYLAIRNAFPDTWQGFSDELSNVTTYYSKWTLEQLNDPELDGPSAY